MSDHNKRVLDFGFRQGVAIIESVISQSLLVAAEELLKDVAANREFEGFTGNTQLSYACGVYVNGQLKHVVFQHNWNGPTKRMKVRKGKVVYLKDPYEGPGRAVRGAVDIVVNHGPELSLKQLEEYRAPRSGVAFVMTTGTEYSEYLEEVKDLNVLTKTYQEAAKIIAKNWKKIDDSFWG